MKGILGAIAISAGWLAVTYRGAALLHKRRGPEAWTLWFALIALSIAATLFHPTVYQAFDRAVGEPNLAQYVGHCFILIAAWQAHAMLLFLVYDRRNAGRKVSAVPGARPVIDAVRYYTDFYSRTVRSRLCAYKVGL